MSEQEDIERLVEALVLLTPDQMAELARRLDERSSPHYAMLLNALELHAWRQNENGTPVG